MSRPGRFRPFHDAHWLMPLVLTAFVVTGCGAAPTSAPSSASKSHTHYPPGITPVQATAMVHQYMKKEWAAEATWNTTGQDAIEVPPQSMIDDMSWIAAKNSHETPPKAPPANLPTTVWVPHGASFFAAYTNGVYMLFVKDPQGWMQAYSPTPYTGAPTPSIALDAEGYAAALSTAQYAELKWTPNELAALYAADVNAAVKTGAVTGGPGFQPGPLTSTVFRGYAAFKVNPPKGASFSLIATPDPVNVCALALKGGGALAFITVSTQFNEHAAPGDVFHIKPTGSESTAIVPAGQYTFLGTQTLQDMAVLIPPKGSAASAQVIADSVGGVNFTFH